MRITEFLSSRQVAYEAIPHAPAFSAQKLAKCLHIKGQGVAKAVLLWGTEGFLLAVLPATHLVDLGAVAAHVGGPVRLATEAETTRVFRDCEWGVVSPFGNLYDLPTLLDSSIAPDAMIVVEGHTHVEALRLRCGDFEALARPARVSFARLSG